MKFSDTKIQGVVVVELDPRQDERGSFARAFCAEEFARQGLESHIEQANLSTSSKAGTLRGLHYQLPPSAETKLIRCVHGALYDVAVDIRRESESFGEWFGIELSEDNGAALLVPAGCAHGFQTLIDSTTAMYMVSAAYDPERERGVHHADPRLGIRWPLEVASLSLRDGRLPYLGAADLP